MSTPVIALDHPAAMDAARVGHEAAALAVARAAGLPAVRGVVLTADWAAHDRRTAELVWRITSHDGHRPLVVRPSDAARRRHHGDGAPTSASATVVHTVDDLLGAAAAWRADGHEAAPLLLHPDVAVAWRGALFADGPAGRRASSAVLVARDASGGDEWIATLDDAGRIRERLSAAAGPAPSDRLLARVTRLATRAAGVLGGPHDLDWTADDDDRVGLVRIRPVVRLRSTPGGRVGPRGSCGATRSVPFDPARPRSVERPREHDQRVA